MTDVVKVTASFTFGDREFKDVDVLNPGDWFGKTWLLEIGIGYSSVYLVVEAGSMEDAVDVLADDETHGHHINVDPVDAVDYDENNSTCAGNDGHLVDLDNLLIHGRECSRPDVPFPVVYHHPSLPTDGVEPTAFGSIDLDKRADALAEIKGPGKFAGCSLLDLIAYEISMDGCCDTLSNEGWGDSDTRVDGPFDDDDRLTPEENAELRAYAGAVVHESSDGFILAWWYATAEELDFTWVKLEAEYAQEYETNENV